MTRKIRPRFLVPRILILCACLSAAALTGPAKAEVSGLLRQALISAELYEKGVEAGDPLLIIAAAQLRKSLDLQPLQPEGEGAGGFAPRGWQEMLAAARAMTAEGDPLYELAEDVASESWKGIASGPVYRIAELGPGAEKRVPDLAFRGGEYAEVYAEAEPGLDLNLAVYDAEGREVCADTHPSHVAYCGWTPAVDGDFTVVISNSGSLAAHFALMTN